jgi:hypothetical protein
VLKGPGLPTLEELLLNMISTWVEQKDPSQLNAHRVVIVVFDWLL